MDGIYTYIWLFSMLNVGKYTIDGSYGYINIPLPWILANHNAHSCLLFPKHHGSMVDESPHLRETGSRGDVASVVDSADIFFGAQGNWC